MVLVTTAKLSIKTNILVSLTINYYVYINHIFSV